MDEYTPEAPTETTSAKSSGVSTHKLHPTVYVLAILVTLGFFWSLGMLMYINIPPENVGSANQLFGILSGVFASVFGFFFGSSLGSKRQGDTIADLAKHK